MKWWYKVLEVFTGSTVESIIQYKQKKKELQHERALEKIRGKIEWEKALTKRASESEGRDAEWEIEQIRNSGWKDEFTLIVLSIPMIGVFIPFVQPYIAIGFDNLSQTPEWYRWLVVMIYAATWGIRVWRRESKIPTSLPPSKEP